MAGAPSDSDHKAGRLAGTYVRLSAFYFFYFALLGGMAPFWGLFLESRGFSALEIGQLMSCLMLTKLVAPNLWAWIADRTAQRLALMRWGCFLALVVFLGFGLRTDFWWFAGVMFLYSFFWNAVLPQFEVITLNQLGDQRLRYSQIRLWGSIGFIAAVQLLGWMFDYVSIEWLPAVLALLLLLIWLAGLQPFLEPAIVHQASGGSLRTTLKDPVVIVFLLANFLLQLGLGPYYTFYSLFMEQQGYSRLLIGTLWAIGVWAEVLLFIVMPRLLARYSLRNITLVSLFLTAIRWLVIAELPQSLPMLVLAQLIHAASFAALHAVAMHFVHERFSGATAGQGQALYASLSFGGGGFVGALLGGLLSERYGMVSAFHFSACVTFFAVLLVFIYFRPAT